MIHTDGKRTIANHPGTKPKQPRRCAKHAIETIEGIAVGFEQTDTKHPGTLYSGDQVAAIIRTAASRVGYGS